MVVCFGLFEITFSLIVKIFLQILKIESISPNVRYTMASSPFHGLHGHAVAVLRPGVALVCGGVNGE
jgi:hypothetical protein